MVFGCASTELIPNTRVADTPMNRELIAVCERYRHAMGIELQNLKASTAWVPRTVGIVRATSPILALATPLIGLLLRRKKQAEPKPDRNGKPKKGLVATALFLFEIARKAKPFWDSFRRGRPRRVEHPKPAPARATPVRGK